MTRYASSMPLSLWPVLLWFALFLAIALSGCTRPANAIPNTIAHPDKAGAEIEYFEERPEGAGPWPTVIFLHGHQDALNRKGGLVFEKWGVLRQFAQKGYLAVSVSLPGYGGSSGPEDFAGPFTQNAVQAVMSKLIADHKAIADKVLIEGVSLGAVTAALLAQKNQQIAGLVLISGLYDFPSFLADPKTPGALAVKAAIYHQTGGSAEALEARSALREAAKIRAATLILNGAQDDRTDPDQARRLAAAISANGTKAIVHIYPDLGHAIPVRDRDAEVNSFIDATLR